jgi:hypothetical protein
MVILLLIALLSVEKRMMIRRQVSSIRRTRATKRVISLTRRSPMTKITLVKNESPMRRAPTPIVMVWQPWLSREHLLQASLSFQISIKGNTLSSWRRRVSVK